jgi:hypothetical protein
MSNAYDTNDSPEWTEAASARSMPARAELNPYRQLFAQPVAALVRCTDERPEIPDVVVLGYN